MGAAARLHDFAHVVVQALTERGLIYIDPLNGREVQLAASERRSAFLQTF